MTDALHPPEDLLPALRNRRSLRNFAPRPVDPDAVTRVFEAARWAPSGGNGQPWRFVLTRRGTHAYEALAGTLKPGNAWATDAPLLILAVVRSVHVHPEKPPRPNRDARLDLGLALGQAFVQASQEGLVTHAMGGFDLEEAARVMHVTAPYEVGVVFAMGYPADPATLDEARRERDAKPRTRIPLDAMLLEDRFVNDVEEASGT